MSVHEFVTIATFYLSLLSDGICSKALAEAFLDKMRESISEFNELQLVLFKTSLEQTFVKERSIYESDDLARAHMFHGDAQLISAMEQTYIALQNEIIQLREAKELNTIEEHVRESVRSKLEQMEQTPGKKKKMFVHEQGEKAVRDKLSEEMHQSKEIKETAKQSANQSAEDSP